MYAFSPRGNMGKVWQIGNQDIGGNIFLFTGLYVRPCHSVILPVRHKTSKNVHHVVFYVFSTSKVTLETLVGYLVLGKLTLRS